MNTQLITCPLREGCGSIVMSVCVCLSVCRKDIPGTTRDIFTYFSVHVAFGRGSALLRQGDEIPRGRGSLGGCPDCSKALAIFAAAVAAAFLQKGSFSRQ